MKLISIVGARPQFIKAAVVSRAIIDYIPDIKETLVHTGQHYDENMSDVFFDELEIPHPDYNLAIGGGTHGQNTGRMIEKIEEVLINEKPDMVLVFGDTDSTLAGSIASVKLHIKVAHVEAGLRSFNRRMPEEINRVLTDHASDILFTPTDTASANLRKEGIAPDKIFQVGDVMYDAALYYAEKAEDKSEILDNLSLEPKSYLLATVHRAENTDDKKRMKAILNGFAQSPYRIIWPVHPRARKRIAAYGFSLPESVRAIDPVGYLDMVKLEKNARMIVTDSGGVQKEAYFHEVPCITLRDETEWIELIESGWNQLVRVEKEEIIKALSQDDFTGDKKLDLYGKGNSGELIASKIKNI